MGVSKVKSEEVSPEYSRSSTPFIFFLIVAVLTTMIAAIAFPSPAAVIPLFIAVLCWCTLPLTIAINREWEEAIILRFGKFQRLVGPGLFFKWPFFESFLKQDKRIVALDVPRQEVMTKDNISVSIDAVVFARVVNTKDSLINIRNLWDSVMKHAQATMRDVVGSIELDDLLAHREEIANRIEKVVEEETQNWGVEIISVKLQNIELPEDMKRVIARQAEAEREKRAVIIKSEGELTAAANLEKAVQQMSNRALYLRTLASLEDISYDPSNTIVFAIPLDIVRGEIIGLTALAKKSNSPEAEQKAKKQPQG
ncbi:MAG: SPFH domain-containing protein [Candidatus Bathyarchaeia archaeon]